MLPWCRRLMRRMRLVGARVELARHFGRRGVGQSVDLAAAWPAARRRWPRRRARCPGSARTPSAMARSASASMKPARRAITLSASWCLRASSASVSPVMRGRRWRRRSPRSAPFSAMRSRKASSSLAVLQVQLLLAGLHLVQRRLRDVDVAALHQLGHLAVEEGQQQRADVGAVDVGVGHDDDAVVAQLGDVEVVGAALAAALPRRPCRCRCPAR